MPSLKDWLERAPRETPTELHEAHCVREGIYSRARVLEELIRWALDPARLESLDESRRKALELIALHGSAGLRLSRLHQLLDLGDFQAHQLADHLRDGLWCAMERDDEGLVLTIFEEHRPVLLHSRLARMEQVDAVSAPLSWHWRFLQGATAALARLKLGKVRTNRDGSLNRRDAQGLADGFGMLSPLGESAPADASRLLLGWLLREGLLRTGQGRLDLPGDAQELLANLGSGLSGWWAKANRSYASQCELWEGRWIEGHEAALWFAGSPTGTSPTWSELPEVLRHGILCGPLEASVREGRLAALRVHPPESPLPDQPRVTPDHTLLLPPGTTLSDWYYAHLLANREDVELYGRFRLDRETWLGGIAVLSHEQATRWIGQLSLPDNVRQSLQTWTEARTLCSVRAVTVLQVRDPRRQKELASLPQLAPFLLEEIPGWGFVVDSRQEQPLRELLARFGYEPPPLREEEVEWRTTGSIPGSDLAEPIAFPSAADPVWPRPALPDREERPATRTRFSGELREVPAADLCPLLDYAVVVDAAIELTLRSAPRKVITLWPEGLDKRKSPILLKARNADGARRDIAIDSIRMVRLVDE